MQNPFKREKPDYTYELERERLLNWLNDSEPDSDGYQTVMARLNELDRMQKRTSEFNKAIIPALGTVGGVAGIYALQQFAGVLVPKALEALAARQEAKKNPQELDY